MPETEGLPRLLSIGQLAERLGTTRRHVRRLVGERRVPFVKVGRLVRLTPMTLPAGWTADGSAAQKGSAGPSPPLDRSPN